MRESDFQTKFTRWLKYNQKHSGAFELKICKKKSLPFNAVQEHQVDALLSVKHGYLNYKIPDDSRGFKPFDCFSLSGPAWVVIQFYSRGVKHFYMIDIDIWVKEIKISKRKSITEERASEIGIKKTLGK